MGKAFFGGGKVGMKKPTTSRLPDGYTELAYIQSSGTQYINTQVKPTANTKICMDFQLTDNTFGSTVFGSRTNSTSLFFLYWDSNNNCWGCAYNTSWPMLSDTASNSLSRNKMEFSGTGLKVNEKSVSWEKGSLATNNYPIFLSARNSTGTVSHYGKMKLYSCQIYENDTLLRDFVPCISDANGVGLYDLVNGKFYGNAGTGSFVGSEVAA